MIKTYDGVDLVKRHWSSSLSHYPEGSLTAREVLATVPVDDVTKREEMIGKLNAELTREIYQDAEVASKRYMELTSRRPRLGNVIVRTDLPPEEVKAANERLSSRIVDIVRSTVK